MWCVEVGTIFVTRVAVRYIKVLCVGMGCIGVCFVQISLVFVSNIGMGDVAVDRNIIMRYRLIGVRCVFMGSVLMSRV
jgi:hypothetical protein